MFGCPGLKRQQKREDVVMTKPESKTVWLQLPEYRVVPLKPRLAEHVMELKQAIQQGVSAYMDPARQDFFDVELKNGWGYIHVYAEARAVYLVAYSVCRSFFSFPHLSRSPNVEEPDKEGHMNEPIAVKFDDDPLPDSPQADLLTVILSRALHDEPNFTYLIPDERQRRAVLPWFFRTLAIRASRVCGEIYTTEAIHGGALWIGPGLAKTFSRVLRSEMLMAPFRLGRTTLRRCLTMRARLEEVHRRLARGPHWYLLILGVEPSDKEDVIREALIDPVLSRADAEGLPCYLEIFNLANLPFYKECGFRIAGAGRIDGGGPNFWALMRAPR
jgi:hypothetical protein